MKLEDFINETLCPAGVVTRWEQTRICMAIKMDDRTALTNVLTELCHKTGVELPGNLIIPGKSKMREPSQRSGPQPSGRYDLASLKRINESYDCEHRVTDGDVTKANDWVRRIEASRSETIPCPGDRVIYTSRHGDYYPYAMVEKTSDGQVMVCERPSIPFVFGKEIYCDISGGAFVGIPADRMRYAGRAKNFFKDWGHCGPRGNGALNFEAEVSVWEYADPEPLYGEFTTKDWRRIYLRKHLDEKNDGGDYLYSGDGAAFRDEDEYAAFIETYNATVFPGNHPDQQVIWCYRKECRHVTRQQWDAIDAPVSSFRWQGGQVPAKGVRDDATHTVAHYMISDR